MSISVVPVSVADCCWVVVSGAGGASGEIFQEAMPFWNSSSAGGNWVSRSWVDPA